MSDDKISTITPQHENTREHSFEEAISATKFGKFNIFLILSVVPACWTSIFETTTMSYVFPAAQCDLKLSLEDKGLLNAVTYAGTITSAFMWGYLYDTLGRKKLLVYGFLLDGIFVLLSGFSQNLTFLMAMKFAGGFIISGPFGGLTAYLSELHGEKYRSLMPLLIGFSNAIGMIYLPLLASLVLPMGFRWNLMENIVVYPWGLYLILNAIPGLLSGVLFMFLPESPRFLMAKCRHDEAVEVFQKMYRINTGNPGSTYPIKRLRLINKKDNEEPTTQKSTLGALKNGCIQILPLLKTPHLKNFILVCTLQMCATCSQNTLRLWLPQMFQAINDYKFLNNGSSTNLCTMLDVIRPNPDQANKECFVNFNNFEVYVNSIIIALTIAGSYIVAGSLINFLGQKLLLRLVALGGAIFASGLYVAPNGTISVILMAGFTAFGSLATTGILGIVVDLFPTTLRTMAVSIAMMTGRSAAMVGNVVFPILLELGCGPPFAMIAIALFLCCLLTYLIPAKSKKKVTITRQLSEIHQ